MYGISFCDIRIGIIGGMIMRKTVNFWWLLSFVAALITIVSRLVNSIGFEDTIDWLTTIERVFTIIWVILTAIVLGKVMQRKR